jgi:hypothetical protein
LKKVFQPDYVSKFRCIASDCEDTCCCGWRVALDKTTFEKYQELTRSGADLFNGKITRDGIMPVEGDFAEVALHEGNVCPFLTDEKLCGIQNAYGEDYLSVTCGVFPRNYSLVNGKMELALHLSCPHAARLALLNPHPMRFFSVDLKENPWLGRIPALQGADAEYPNNLYPYFDEVRTFILTLLQNRKYCFEDRLMILGRFCNDLHLNHDRPKDEIIQLIGEYTHLIDAFGFSKFIGSIPEQPASLLNVLINLMEFRLKTGVKGQRFLECFEQFREGLHYTDATAPEELADSYTRVKSGHYDPFMQQYEYILENYFVNYVFKALFPFSQQVSIYQKDVFLVPRTIFTEYIILVLHYAMIKNLLIGTAGYYQEQFGTQQVLKLIQSFDKNIGRDVPYHQKLLKFFDDNHMINIACAAMLVKN